MKLEFFRLEFYRSRFEEEEKEARPRRKKKNRGRMEGRRKIIKEEEEEQMQRSGEWWNSSYTWIFFHVRLPPLATQVLETRVLDPQDSSLLNSFADLTTN